MARRPARVSALEHPQKLRSGANDRESATPEGSEPPKRPRQGPTESRGGPQNAVVRRLAVPDLTTTVLTLTVTGLVANNTPPSVRTRRLTSVLAMLAGALTGGVLLRWVALAAPLWLAAALLVACAAGAYAATGPAESQAWG
jgi:hypothetical protein